MKSKSVDTEHNDVLRQKEIKNLLKPHLSCVSCAKDWRVQVGPPWGKLKLVVEFVFLKKKYVRCVLFCKTVLRVCHLNELKHYAYIIHETKALMPRAIFIWLKSHMYKKYLRVGPLAQREIKRMSNDVQKGVRLNFDGVYKF